MILSERAGIKKGGTRILSWSKAYTKFDSIANQPFASKISPFGDRAKKLRGPHGMPKINIELIF